jgi:hypothetical protein
MEIEHRENYSFFHKAESDWRKWQRKDVIAESFRFGFNFEVICEKLFEIFSKLFQVENFGHGKYHRIVNKTSFDIAIFWVFVCFAVYQTA